MLQRLGLAQALIGKPRFLLLDEPSSGVDPTGVLFFFELLRGLKAQGVTVVLNSHQLEQMERICDRVAFIQKGRIEVIETLGRDAAEERALEISFLAGASEVTLREAAAISQAVVLELAAGRAVFTVRGDAGAAKLLRALHGANVEVIEASRKERRLERFFTGAA